MTVATRDRPAAIIFDVGGTILEERWFDLDAALLAVVPDARLAGDLSAEFRRVLSEQHRANREVPLAGWLLERLPKSTVTLQELEDALWLHVVELVPRSTVGDVLAQLTADRIPVAAVSCGEDAGSLARCVEAEAIGSSRLWPSGACSGRER